MSEQDWVVVYRGFAVPALDLIEGMLNAEGLQPRRRGKASPALLGIGDWALEQSIEVPREHEPAALALIAGSLQPPAEPSDELEREALSARPEPAGQDESSDRRGFDPTVIALIVAVAALLLLLLQGVGCTPPKPSAGETAGTSRLSGRFYPPDSPRR